MRGAGREHLARGGGSATGGGAAGSDGLVVESEQSGRHQRGLDRRSPGIVASAQSAARRASPAAPSISIRKVTANAVEIADCSAARVSAGRVPGQTGPGEV